MDIYAELGVRTWINCAGTYTLIGGSRMHEDTLVAMNRAARAHVCIPELQRAVHRRIAELTRNEAACVTAGAMAGIHLAIASCISMKHGKPLKYLPSDLVRSAEVIMFRAHRNPYDRGLEFLGVTLVELGYPNYISIVTPEEFESAITEKTAAVLYLPSCEGGWVPPGALDFERTLAVASARGIPLIVDAAAQLPPKANLWAFTQAGASAAVFSGGKDLHGPQTTGLALGKAELMGWMDANNFPSYGIGRMHKVGREELAGIYAAVKRYMAQDEAKRRAACEAVVGRFVEAFGKSEAFYFERSWPNEAGQPLPRAKMIPRHPGANPARIQEVLAADDRPIFVMVENGFVYINPMTVTEEEADYVLSAFRKIQEGMTAQ